MGWTFPYDALTRKQMVADRCKEQRTTRDDGTEVAWRTIKSCYRGGRYKGTLWRVVHKQAAFSQRFGE